MALEFSWVLQQQGLLLQSGVVFFNQRQHGAHLGNLAQTQFCQKRLRAGLLEQFAVGMVCEQVGKIFRQVQLHTRTQTLPQPREFVQSDRVVIRQMKKLEKGVCYAYVMQNGLFQRSKV